MTAARKPRIHHEYRENLGRLRRAGIGADAAAVARQLGEALSGLVGLHRSVIDLTADRSLKHGRIGKGGFGMRVTRRAAAGAVFDEHALDAPAGNVWQLLLAHWVTLAFFDFGAAARTFPNSRVATSSERRIFIEPEPRVLPIQDQAAACKRRSHSSKRIRPRRASPNGTSESSSTRPPK
jgi:hypothetical protein